MKITGDKIIKYRWLIIVGFIIVTLFFAAQFPNLIIDSNIKNQLPPDMTSRLNTDRIEELFGGTEMIMVLIETDDVLKEETLQRVKKLSKKIHRIRGVDKVMSLFDLKSIKSQQGAMLVNPVVKKIPRTEVQRDILRKEIRENDIVYGSVVSEDFTLTAVIGVLRNNAIESEVIPAVEKSIREVPGKERVIAGGLPYTRFHISKMIQQDMKRLMPIGILIMLVFLFTCFRQPMGVMLPFLVVIMSICTAMGLIPLLGWKVQIITIILPVFMIAVANDYGIHMIAKYQEYNTPGNSLTSREIAKGIFHSLNKPVLMTGLTTMAGMLCLLGHVLPPARELAILSAVGIVYALAASLLLLPAVMSLLPLSKPVLHNGNKKHLLEKLLSYFSKTVARKPKTVIVCSLLLSLIAATGIFFIIVDSDPKSYFPSGHKVLRAADLIDKELGGSQNISIVFEGDIKDPAILKKIDKYERSLNEMDIVGNTTSVARLVRQMSRALNDSNETWYDRIPDTRNAAAQYFELYSMSGDPEDFEKMVDFPYEHAVITARINKTSTSILSEFINRIEKLTKNDTDVLLIGGFGVVLKDLARLVVNGQLFSLLLATIIVAIMLMILFRSFTAGFISAIPLALSMAILFGLMGHFGITLNIATAMLSSIMIGVGIDYTIHFLWRYREERKNGLEPDKAVEKTLTTTGRGIVFNAFSVIIGFSALLFSGFLPVKFFGFLVVVTIFACMIGALVLIPALCIVLRPKFLEPAE